MPLIKVPEDFLCPISRELMLSPTSTIVGQTYEFQSIRKWLFEYNNNIDPVSGLVLSEKQLIPNVLVKKLIQQFLEEKKVCTSSKLGFITQFGTLAHFEELNFLEQYLSQRNEDGRTLLHLAVLNRHHGEEVARLLLPKEEEEPEKEQEEEELREDDKTAEMMSSHRFPSLSFCLNSKDNSGGTPIHLAARCNRPDVLRVFLSHPDRRLEIQDNFGHTPLHLAAGNNSVECLEVLVNGGANLLARDTAGCTPLHIASYNSCLDTTSRILKYFKDSSRRKGQGRRFTYSAEGGVFRRQEEEKEEGEGEEELFPSRRSLIDAEDHRGRTPLMLACSNKNVEVVRVLLMEGRADRNKRNREGMTPLHYAARYNRCGLIRLLLEDDGTIEKEEQEVEEGGEMVEMEEEEEEESRSDRRGRGGVLGGEGVEARDSLGQTPLHLAVLNNCQEAVKLLGLEYKSKNVNEVDNFGLGAIHHAVINNLEEMLRLLLTHRQAFQLDPNLIYSSTISPSTSFTSSPVSAGLGRGNALHLAVKYDYEPIVRLLMEFGVNPHVKNHEGWNPSQLAERLGYHHLCSLLATTTVELQTFSSSKVGRESNEKNKKNWGDKNNETVSSSSSSSPSKGSSRSVLQKLMRVGSSLRRNGKRSRSPPSTSSSTPSFSSTTVAGSTSSSSSSSSSLSSTRSTPTVAPVSSNSRKQMKR